MCNREGTRDVESIGEKWGKNDYLSVFKLFQSPPSLICQKMRAGRHRRSFPVFQTPHHALLEKNFFFFSFFFLPLPVCDDSEVFLCLKLCMNLLCFYKGFWELRAKAKCAQILLWKSPPHPLFEAVALHIFGEKFLRFVRGC